MANRKVSGNTYKGAIIDTAPGGNGFWSDAVKASDHHVGKIFYSIIGIFNATISLQFKLINDPTWTDYDDPLNAVDPMTEEGRGVIEDYSDTQWRIGVKSGNFTSGAVRVRIDYHNGEDR
jgi:hypothetical protein